MDVDGDPDEDDIGAEWQEGARSADGEFAATDAGAAAGPSYTMDVIEGEWDGLLEESRGTRTAAGVSVAQPAAAEPAQASQPTEAEAAALNKRQRRQEKKRLAEEREAAIRKAVCMGDPSTLHCLAVLSVPLLRQICPGCTEPSTAWFGSYSAFTGCQS